MGSNNITKSKIKILIYFIYIFSLFSLITTSTFPKSQMKYICSNSDDYISSFLTENDEEIIQDYKDFTPEKPLNSNNEYILNVLFFNKGAINIYEKKRMNVFNLLKSIYVIILLFSFAIFINFNFHFICRLQVNDENEEDNTATLIKFSKISSFSWVKYLVFNKEKRNEFYFNYLKNELPKTNKSFKIISLLVSFILLVLSIIFAIYNNYKFDYAEKTTYNISCALMKLLHEMKYGKNNFIGLDKINEFFSEFSTLNENNKQNTKKFDQNLLEIKIKINEWNTYINNLNEKLSNQNSKEFYIVSYPSEIKCKTENISICSSHKLYQLKNIYDYYPSNEINKNLYQINNFMHSNIDNIYSIITEFNEINKNVISLNSENSEDIYSNILSNSNKLLDIYINKLSEKYLPDIHNYFLNDITSFLFNIDFAYATLLALCCLLFIPVISYSLNKKCMQNKLLLIILFYNSLFVLLILSICSCIKITEIKVKINFVEDISNAIYFLFDIDNQDYLNKNNKFLINNINLNIKDENQTSKNIFYYLNYIINNDKEISELFEFNPSKINKAKIENIYNKLNYIIKDGDNNIMNNKIENENMKIFAKLLEIDKEGLAYNTYFKDITGQGIESPSNYFTFINSITQSDKRLKNYINDDFDCDESWNISTSQKDNYMNRKNVIDCDGCINHYFGENVFSKTPLLNYMEYSLKDIMDRYSDLKNNFSDVYYELIYQFKALENFRSDDLKNQAEKLYDYNKYLINLENNIYDIFNQTAYLTKEIITTYQNLFTKYSIYNNYSFLNCDFFKTDINFVLSETENTLVKNVNRFYNSHLLGNIIHFILFIVLIIFYSIVSYEIPLPKKNQKHKIDHSTIIKEIKKIKQNEHEDNDKSQEILNVGPFCGANIAGSITIVKEGTTINNNEINPQYNTLFCGNENNIFNGEDLVSLSKKIENELNALNKCFNQDPKIGSFEPIREVQNENSFDENNEKSEIQISKINKDN